jgi:DnaJ-class molecular chaperone
MGESDDEAPQIKCPNCGGTGRIKPDNLNPKGICPWCKGSGRG